MATLMREPSRRRRMLVLESAYGAGVRHFDVAPLYGLGRAEPDLGEFLKSHGIADVTVASKFGLAPTRKARLVAPIQGPIRAAMGRSQLIRRLGKRAEQATGTVTTLLPSELKASVTRSLEHLGRDSLDLLVLHEVPWSTDWSEVWQGIQRSGTYSGLGVSGTPALLQHYPAEALGMVKVVQAPPSPSPQIAGQQRILHSALSQFAIRVRSAIEASHLERLERLAAIAGTADLDDGAARVLSVLGLLAVHQNSIVLVGTTNPLHISGLVNRVGRGASVITEDSAHANSLAELVSDSLVATGHDSA